MLDYYRAAAFEQAYSRTDSKRKSRQQAAKSTGAGGPRVIGQAMARRQDRATKPSERPTPIEYLMLRRSASKRDA
jgi:hypothetical protein